ncbi:MAG TPA: PRC-barrel domain-containing protein [Polyangiaceae bacterium]|nr:PRC-barrel domain-containing protein [Polyangiaceae bacterium]
MRKNATELRGHTLRAVDGDLGLVDDLLFDEQKWVIRHFVVDTGNWLAGRKVLISPIAFGEVQWQQRVFKVMLTRGHVQASPELRLDGPLTRREEAVLFDYYGYLPYWSGLALWGLGIYPAAAGPVLGSAELAAREDLAALGFDLESGVPSQRSPDPQLRSVCAMVGSSVHCSDGELGHVVDLVLDCDTFEVDSMVVQVAGRSSSLLVAPHRVTSVTWDERRIEVALPRAAIQREAELGAQPRRAVPG